MFTMKIQSLLFLALGATAAPAPEVASDPAQLAARAPRRLLCTGLLTGNPLSSGDIRWALNNRINELQLNSGRTTSAVNTVCRSTDGRNIAQEGVWITFDGQRSDAASTTLANRMTMVCQPQSSWRLSCNPA